MPDACSGSSSRSRLSSYDGDLADEATTRSCEKQMRTTQASQKYDSAPLEDDRWGNAIIGAVGGGVAGGLRKVATDIGASIFEHVAIATAKSAACGSAREVARETAETAVDAARSSTAPHATSDAAWSSTSTAVPSAPAPFAAGPPEGGTVASFMPYYVVAP